MKETTTAIHFDIKIFFFFGTINTKRKIWINRLRSACPQAPFSLVLAEAQLVKNLTTRRHGYSAQLLALGLPDGMRLQTLTDDLTVPGPPVDEVVKTRAQLKQAAREAVSDSKTDSIWVLVFQKGPLSLLFSNTVGD